MPKVLLYVLFLGPFVASITKLKNLNSSVLSSSVAIKSYVNDERTTMYTASYYYKLDGKTYNCVSSSSTSIRPDTKNKLVYYDSANTKYRMLEYSKGNYYLLLIFLLIPIVFILIAVINIRKINKRVKAILELNQKGKLIKGLPYRLENSGIIVNNVPMKRLVVDYILPSSSIVTLYGDVRNDRRSFDADGKADLLIDESNPEN